MAELPRYQPTGYLPADVPRLDFANGEAVTLMVNDGTAYTLTWTDATFGGSGVVWKTLLILTKSFYLTT